MRNVLRFFHRKLWVGLLAAAKIGGAVGDSTVANALSTRSASGDAVAGITVIKLRYALVVPNFSSQMTVMESDSYQHVGVAKNGGRMNLWRGNGKSPWIPRTRIGSMFKCPRIAYGGDCDGDERSGIVSLNDITGLDILHRSIGDGGWLACFVLTECSSPYKNSIVLSVGYLEQDGCIDIINNSTGKLNRPKGELRKKAGDSKDIEESWHHLRSIT